MRAKTEKWQPIIAPTSPNNATAVSITKMRVGTTVLLQGHDPVHALIENLGSER